MATIREDVVSISFDVEENPFAAITAGIDEMKTAVTGGVDESTEELKSMAQDATKAADGIGDLARSARELGSTDAGGLKDDIQQTTQETQKAQKGFTDMIKSARDIAKVKIDSGLDKLKSIPDQAKGKFDKLKDSVQKIKNIKLTDIGKGLDVALGKGVTAGGKLFTALKKAAGVGFDKVTSGVRSLATQAGKAAISLGKGLAKGAVACVGAASAAVGGLVAKSVSAFADFEQLEGGVDTLFKGSAQTIKNYANDAYKTAGLSANQYMETVTSFSASLISSVGGDTKKAVSLADMAITDMADNANKMGTSMETVTETYQSLAKGNYAMLDNLKLGYGGTKSEMQRLIKDAAKLDSSVDANSMSYGNMVKALHAVQENMGITGTTAAEAEKTISGSLASMKSAWGNLMPALIQGGDSFDQCVNNLVESVKIFAGNIMPVIKSALSGVVKLIQELLPIILAEIPSILSELLPQITNAGIQLLQTLLTSISSNIGMISSGAMQLVTKFAQFILGALPQIITTGMQLILSLVNGISQQLPTLIPMAIRAITTLVQGLVSMLPQIISAGIKLLVSLVQGIAQSLPQLIPAGVKAIVTLIQGITGAIPQLLSAALKLIPVVLKAIISNLPQILQGGIKIIVSLVKGLGQAIPQLISFLPKVGKTIISSLKSINLVSVGKNLIQGFVKGIKSMFGAVKNAAKNIAKSAGNTIKNALDINSPSKLTLGYGKFTGEGLALGIQKMKDNVTKAAQGLSTVVSAKLEPSTNSYMPSSSNVSNTSSSNVTNNFNPQFTLNMNGASATDSNKRKVKQWVKESIQETFESMGRTNPELCEV